MRLPRTTVIGMAMGPGFRRELNERRIPSSTESSSLARSSARIAQHEIAVLLEQLVLPSIAAVRDRIREMLSAVNLNDDSRIFAQEIYFHSSPTVERNGQVGVHLESSSCLRQ